MKKIIILMLLGIILIGIGGYLYISSPYDKNSKKEIEIEVPSGTSVLQVGNILYKNKLINNLFYYKVKVKLIKPKFKSGIYTLKQSMTPNEIIELLAKGATNKGINITFREGERFTDYAKVISQNTNNTEEDVIKLGKDKTYLKELISKYWFVTDKILQDGIYYPLEGYLAPNTYNFTSKNVSVKQIFKTLLDEQAKVLEPYKDKIKDNPHEVLTMASIVEKEGKLLEDKRLIAGVFYNRLEKKIALGSDVTTYYAEQKSMKIPLTQAELDKKNKYNTRNKTMLGLPISPISSCDKTTIEATVNYKKTDYLYFVADSNMKVHFMKTYKEHLEKIKQLKEQGKWIG